VTTAPARLWFSCNFFVAAGIYLASGGRIDLVALHPRQIEWPKFDIGDPASRKRGF